MRAGAVGEVVGWAIDKDGRVLEGDINRRDHLGAASAAEPGGLWWASPSGPPRSRRSAALSSDSILTGLITDEATAIALLGS